MMQTPLVRRFARLARLGDLASDSADNRLRRAIVILFASLTVPAGLIVGIIYLLLGQPLAASLPLTYSIAAACGALYATVTTRFSAFQYALLSLILSLPFLTQWALGGYVPSSAVSLWGALAPLGALLIHSARQSLYWLMAFVVLTIASGIFDRYLSARAAALPPGMVVALFAFNIIGVISVAYMLLRYFVQERTRALARLAEANCELQAEQEKAERLLLNVLPAPVAERLKSNVATIADGFDEATVLFADLVDFTVLSSRLSPSKVVDLLNGMFSSFDLLAERHGLEKIKTIGDAYMAVGGLPSPRADHAEACAEMALDMRVEVARMGRELGEPLHLRIGVNTGPVVAGVIGIKKFIYDLWGDTVNMASRMESHGLVDSIQVTVATYERLQENYLLAARGEIEIKGKGPTSTYFLLGRKRPWVEDRPVSPPAPG